MSAIVGIAKTQGQAAGIIGDLARAGVPDGDISVLCPDTGGDRDFGHERNSKAPEGAVAGVSTGGVIGGALGLLAGIGAIAIPGVGPLIAAGPIMAAMSGVAAGATVGGLAGGLVGYGFPEYEAKLYDGKVRSGNILISVHIVDGPEEKRVNEIFKAGGVEDISTVTEHQS